MWKRNKKKKMKGIYLTKKKQVKNIQKINKSEDNTKTIKIK